MTLRLTMNLSPTKPSAATGPRTPEGKARSSRNAIRHGLLANELVLGDEDPADLERLAAGIRSALAPEGQLESLLADQVVSAAWRLGRARQIESELLELQRDDTDPGRGLAAVVFRDTFRGNGFALVMRYQTMLERSLRRGLHELERRQAMRRGQTPVPPLAVDLDVEGDEGTPPQAANG
jgi:hypothetical protein